MPSKAAANLWRTLSPRTQSQMNQSDLARKLGVTPQAVSAWVHGKTLPTPETMAQLEDLLGIPMREWTEPAPASPEEPAA